MSEINDGGSTYSELEIALPQIPHEFLLTAQVSIEDILAVQSLAMGFLRMRARRQRRDPQLKRYGFVMLDKGGLDTADVYDGSTDTYMGCFVQKVHPDQWHMLVSFLDTTNTEATKAQNTRRMYIFDWLRSGKRQAWYTEIFRKYEGTRQTVQVLATHPVSTPAVIALQNEMLEISQRVNPMNSQSIYTPPTQALE